MIRFESEVKSGFEDIRRKFTFFQESYEGIDATVIGGSGKVYYLDKNWTDYLQASQEVIIQGSVSLSDIVISFTYNELLDRTEVTLTNNNFLDQTRLYNDINSLSSFTPTFNPTIESVSTEWKEQGAEILSPIKTSYTDIVYLDRDEDSSVDATDNEWWHRFVENWNTETDTDSKLIIYKWDGANWDIEWAGVVVPDLLEWDNFPSPRPYTFRVNDGIETLKDVRYDKDINNLQDRKCIYLIKEVLDQLDLSQFWGASEPYIYESIEYNSTEITPSAAYSPLDYTFIPENMLIERDDRDEKEFISFYDVLLEVMRMFSARITLADGAYRINQVRNYDNNTAYTARVFNKTNNLYTNTAVNFKETLDVHAGGKFGYYKGLREVRIYQNFNQNALLDISSGELGKVIGNGSNPVTYPDTTVSLGNIYNDGGDNKIRVELDVFEINQFNLNNALFLDVAIEITTPDNANIFIKGNDNIPVYWGNDTTTTDRFWGKRVYSQQATNNTNVIFETPFLPYDITNAELEIRFFLGSTSGSNPQVMFPNNYEFFSIRNVKVNFPTNEDETNVSQVLSVENTNTNYTEELELEDLVIKENTTVSSVNTIQINNSYTGSGSSTTTLTPSSLWDADFDGNDSLALTRVLEAMSLQARPVEKYYGKFDGQYYPHEAIEYNYKVYVMSGMKHNYYTDEYDGEWFEVITARGGLSGGIDDGGIDESDGGVNETSALAIFNTTLNTTQIKYTSSEITAASITSIPIVGFADLKIKENDIISLINPTNQSEYTTFEVASDVASGATSISVTAKTINNNIPAGAIIKHTKGEVLESNRMRAEYLDSKYPSSLSHREGRIYYDQTNKKLKYGDDSKFLNLLPNQNNNSEKTDLSGLNNNDYPIGNNNNVNVNCTDSVVRISGFEPAQYVDGMRLIVANVSSNQLEVTQEDTASTAANRISGSGTLVINQGQYIEFIYSTEMDRWMRPL